MHLNFSIEEQQKFLPKLVFKLKSYYKPMIKTPFIIGPIKEKWDHLPKRYFEDRF